MDRRDLPVIHDPVVGANTPISQRSKGAIEVTADETASSPKEERFMIRKRAVESAEEAELVPPKLNHVTGEPATTNLTTTPNAAVLPASSVAVPVEDDDDVDKQRMMWEALEEKREVWDAIDEQQKLRKKEDRKKKQEKRRQKHEETRQKEKNNKKRKLEVEAGRKEKKKKTSTKTGEPNMIRQEVRGSPLAGRGSPLAGLHVVSSPGVNALRSRIGFIANVAASKRVRLSSEISAGSSSEKRAKSVSRSPSISSSPSPPTSKTVHRRGRKVRRLTSAVWKDFYPRYHDGKLVQAQCKHCSEFLPAGRDMGTSGVRRHLATCQTRSELDLIVQKLKSSVSSPNASVLKNWEFDQKVSRKLLARMIILDEMPFSIVEYSGFQDFVRSLNPLFNMVSRNTIKEDCMQLYNDKRSIYCEGFKLYKGRVSLTTDMWTSNQTLGYMCITCHFIDAKWKLQKKIIRFVMLETPHNGVAMFTVLLKSLQDWNIEDKIFSITVDNASVNGTMLENLRDNLVSKNMLHYDGKLLHIRCACHVLNLIVQDGLTTMKYVVDNIRESVKYIKSSQPRQDKFKEVVARVGISCKLPSVDVSTRWNSTYLMLESSFPFRKAFQTLGKEDTNYKFCPTSEEWRRSVVVCSMLKVFYTATQVVSGSSYPTSNLYFHQIWNVRVLLEKEASRKDPIFQSMVKAMQEKFNKYWTESYVANSIPVILDPRFKYGFIEFRLEQAYGSDVADHLTKVKAALESLFKEYASEILMSPNDSTQPENVEEVAMEEHNPLADWDNHLSMKQRQPSNELERYLQEETFPRKDDFDILQWWSLHSSKYPVLSQIARDILAVPASVVPSESAFSTGSRVVSDYRSRLDCTTVEALICLQDWFKQYNSLAECVDDNE